MKLAGQKLLVTGGFGLLGSAVVQEIERRGGIPVLTSRDIKKVDKFNKMAKESSRKSRAAYLKFDNETDLHYTLKDAIKVFGPFHGLVNNAFCRLSWKSAEETSWSDWSESMRVNVFVPHVISIVLAETGELVSVVNVSSMYAVVAPNFQMYSVTENPSPISYGTTKAALLALTRYLAAYWGARGIRVNAVSPGGILNDQKEEFLQRYGSTVPIGRMVTKEEVAAVVCFLLGKESSGITGQNIIVDGGRTIW